MVTISKISEEKVVANRPDRKYKTVSLTDMSNPLDPKALNIAVFDQIKDGVENPSFNALKVGQNVPGCIVQVEIAEPYQYMDKLQDKTTVYVGVETNNPQFEQELSIAVRKQGHTLKSAQKEIGASAAVIPAF